MLAVRDALPISLLAASILFPAAAAAQPPAPPPVGKYECWAHGAARMLMNFNVTGPGSYTDPDGKQRGSFTMGAGGLVTFKGGHLDGVMPTGFVAKYYTPKGRPTVSFGKPGNLEAAFCEKVK
jgi:hypothetical protein